MTRYYASGFDAQDAFGHGLGEAFKKELKRTKNILYIPAGEKRVEKAKEKDIPTFTNHFKNVGIEFENVNLLTPDLDSEVAKKMVKNADFIMLMGGDPFELKQMCEKLNVANALKNYNGIMLGFSAGAMYMSKYIIITPCSEEYLNFHIERGLNLDDISIYPHNNTDEEVYPDVLVVEDENKTFKKEDLIEVAKEFGTFYLLQDNGKDISMLKSKDRWVDFYTEGNGKIWAVDDDVRLITERENKKL